MRDRVGIGSGRAFQTLSCVVLWLAGCGGGSSAVSSEPSPQQQLANLEASGAIPVLDREPTLAGIDANGNGVRDDIERYIDGKYPDAAQRKAAIQTAHALQTKLLVNLDDSTALDEAATLGVRAVNCRSIVFPGIDGIAHSWRMSSDIEAMTANTKTRLMAYLAYNKARSGTVSTLPEGNTCD